MITSTNVTVHSIIQQSLPKIYKVDPNPDPDLHKRRTLSLYKKQTLCQNSLHWLKRIFDKFEGGDFTYDNKFFKFQSKNTQIRHFWIQIYFSHKTLHFDKFEGADFKYDNIFFQTLP